ncbi:hypothetical protein H2200_011157 [Cladophialophora chaetospira]|uniref:Eukaryotic translation initiation factor 4E type 3 n=1 Tax=Cladophialophora chaetospira TaxID=386627 RepID=A0AA38X043_9EURO|nr:hypothetical protein H2200_011157 [Cladophialophora chaetospira]
MSSTATTTMLHTTLTLPSLAPPDSTIRAPKSEPESRPGLPRRSSSLHKLLITKLRPLPFQYMWSVWHSKSSASMPAPQAIPLTQAQQLDVYHLNLLVDSVADIGAFYRIFNNLPWSSVRQKDSIHIFRAGVRPLWEDEENRKGGRWLLRVRPDFESELDGTTTGLSNGKRKDVRTWEEVCLLCLGGELQSVIAQERDHILGVSFSPRNNFTHISIWTKQGDNQRSILLLERAILSGLSADLRPKSSADFNYRKHADKIGYTSGVGFPMIQSRQQLQVQMMGPFLPPLPSIGAAVMSRPGPIRALTVG